MTDRLAGRLAVGAYAVTVAMTGVAFVLLVLSLDVPQLDDAWGPRGFGEMLALGAGTVGIVIARRQPSHLVAWCFLGAGVMAGVQAVGDEWATYTILGGRDLPAGAWGAWFVNWVWIVGVGLLLCYVVLLFPDGRFASTGARRFGIAAAVLLGVPMVVNMFGDYELQGYGVDNPLGILPVGKDAAETSLMGMIIAIVGTQVVFVRRLRRAHGVEREQLRWLVVGEASAALGIASSMFLLLDPSGWVGNAIETLGVAGLGVLFVCTAIALVRYRLYDVDLVISRSLMFLGMTAFVTVAYVAIVAGVGALVQRTDEPNHLLAVTASVVVALAFQPVRDRLHRLADRIAYGTRAEPYEVLASLSEQLRATQDPEAALESLARSLTHGTGASSTTIWLRVVDELRPTACFPPQELAPEPVPVDRIRDLPGDRVEAVEHDGEVLGAISLTKRYADALPAAEDRLVGDIAAHAGLLLRNLRLTAELHRHIEELRESRQRLVTAQDAERRRLERDLHDGAQQQLVALKVQLGLARHIARDEGATKTDDLIAALSNDLGDAIATLRELAHGIYPPRLAADGLVPALSAQAAKSAVPCEVVGEVNRYSPDVEAAAYFCCLEAMQNVAKYANASSACIQLRARDTHLEFEVVDDGAGFDPAATAGGIGLANMRDRVEALGGKLTITSAPGAGARVAGTIPIEQPAVGAGATVPGHV